MCISALGDIVLSPNVSSSELLFMCSSATNFRNVVLTAYSVAPKIKLSIGVSTGLTKCFKLNPYCLSQLPINVPHYHRQKHNMIIVVSDHCLHLCLSVSKCSSGFSAVICWSVTSSSSCSCLTFPLSWVCSCPCCCSVSFSLEVCRQWYHTGMHELLKELPLLKAEAIKAKIKLP